GARYLTLDTRLEKAAGEIRSRWLLAGSELDEIAHAGPVLIEFMDSAPLSSSGEFLGWLRDWDRRSPMASWLWSRASFENLAKHFAGLTLAVPLVCLGSIYPLENQELTPLFGQPDWFLGILPSQAGNLKVLDTARWVMPERYRDDYRDGLKYVISVQGYEWGLAVHQVSRSIRLDPAEVKWRSQRSQRPWLAGTVIEHMCALLDVAALAELIASGAVKRLHGDH
ncbi:DUF4123 domain-containing protein, partial [Pseudomonas aeruginosa]|nr:DUF4123 domain-containing protein [Pseudomonas aeruginosa]